MASIISIDDLRGPAGRLEALLNTGVEDARFAVLLCHPHPPSGGNLHNKVVYHAAKVFSGLGLPVLRFNFRGVGKSEGFYDRGRGEIEDARVALNYLKIKVKLPILAAGFSFGAAMAMAAGHDDDSVKALIALGLPIFVPAKEAAGDKSAVAERRYLYPFLTDTAKPKLFLSGDSDDFAPAEKLHELMPQVAAPKELILIPEADHFFHREDGTGLKMMQKELEKWLKLSFFA